MEVCASDRCRVGVEDANIANGDDDEGNDGNDDENAFVDHDGGSPDLLLVWRGPVSGRIENAETRRFRRMMIWEGTTMAKTIITLADIAGLGSGATLG
jgi:hypothetical protein